MSYKLLSLNNKVMSNVSGTLTLGARGDSYYEYLLKQWIQTGEIRYLLILKHSLET